MGTLNAQISKRKFEICALRAPALYEMKIYQRATGDCLAKSIALANTLFTRLLRIAVPLAREWQITD